MQGVFAQWQFAAAAAGLADALDRRRARAVACARALHQAPHGPVKVFRVNRYEESLSPRRRLDFAVAFPTWRDFTGSLRAEDPGALETALEILSRIAPEETLPFGRAIVEAKPWTEMGLRSAQALSRIDDPRAVAVALAHPDVPYIEHAIGASICQRATPAVLARLARSPVVRPMKPSSPRDETDLVAELICFLGRHRVDAAWKRIAQLYARHGSTDVRVAAGHALIAYGDERSRELLLSLARDRRDWMRFFAVRAAFTASPASAITTLGGFTALQASRGAALAGELLHQAASLARETGSPIADKQLVDLALAWVKDRRNNDAAQAVLDHFGKKEVAAAKKRLSSGTPAPRFVPPPSKTELANMRAAMRRARSNLERIVGRLHEAGYRFAAKQPLAPRGDRTRIVRAIEKALEGPLPASLRLAFEEIGACDLTGTFPGQRADLMSDALVLIDPRHALVQAQEEGGREAQVSLGLAPDAVGKAGFSGGQEVMLVPDASLDAPVLGVRCEPLFLERLRKTFRCGGFPGLANAKGSLGAEIKLLSRLCEPL